MAAGIYLQMMSDLDLLDRYVREHRQEAFAALVDRHLKLVYSAALRQVRSPELAEEVSQSVFADLARSADKMEPQTILSAWLYQVTRRTAINVVRGESRRQLREQIALDITNLNANTSEWMAIEPLLDEAMEALDPPDRTAILLRYFEDKSLREVGQALGTSEDAAQKRVSRALDQLREFFSKRGRAVGVGGLAALISANAAKGDLNTDEDYRKALSGLRSAAESTFITTVLTPALNQYEQANQGQFPASISQLQPYFNPPVDDSILQRWEVAPKSTVPSLGVGDSIITQIAAVDADYDTRFGIGLNGSGSAGPQDWDAPGTGPSALLTPAIKAYAAANNGLQPTDLSQLAPYLTTPEEQAALQLAIKRSSR